MSSIKPAQDGDQIEGRKEVPGGLVIACGDCSELFDPAKEVLDQMASFVQRFVELSGVLAMPFWRNHVGYACRLQRLNHSLVGVKRLIRQQSLRLQPGQERIRPGQIMDLARGQDDLQRVAQRVCQNVKFAAQTAFASADRLVFADFFLAPALC